MNQTVSSSSECFPGHITVASFYISLHALCLTGIISNILLLVGFYKDPFRCIRNSPSYLLCNLAVCDILICIVISFFIYLPFCLEISSFIQPAFHSPFYISYFSMITIAFDRYLSVIHPLKYKIIVNGKKTFGVILLKWCLALTYVVLVPMLDKNYTNWDFKVQNAFGALTILVTIFLYVTTAYKLRKESKTLDSLEGPSSRTAATDARKTHVRKQKRFLSTIFLVSVITIISQVPIHSFSSISSIKITMASFRVTNQQHPTEHHIFRVLYVVFTFNFCINPFIYWWRLTNYRKTFVRILCKQRGSSQTDSLSQR